MSIFGVTIFDFTREFGFGDLVAGAIIVLGMFYLLFVLVKNSHKKNSNDRENRRKTS